jgi:hypothetical protein
METPAKQKKETPWAGRKDLEQCFLSAILSGLAFDDLREVTAGYRGVTWRHFRDRRHQVIWRVLRTLDLSQSFEERLDILIAEDGDPKPDLDKLEKLSDRAQPLAWLERELRAAGALSLAGGKAYIRELAERYAASAAVGFFAKKLKFV